MDSHTQTEPSERAADSETTADVDVAGLIRRVRRRMKFSQRELAEELGVSQSAVAKWETGRRPPTARMLCRILRLAEVRLVAIDQDGERVRAMRTDAARDAGQRRYPAHTFVWAEEWWAPPGAEMTAWLGPILSRSRELDLPRVRYSRRWEARRELTPADLDDHPTWRELVEQASAGWAPPRRAPVQIPAWALVDSKKSRNRRPADFRAPVSPLGRTG